MRKFATVIVLALAMAFAACGGGAGSSSSSSPTLAMGNSDFTPSNPTVNMKVGQTLKITSQGGHILVTGTSGKYEAEAGAPDALNNSSGVTFKAGDTQTYTFSTAGTYHIACLVHPAMNATVIVAP